MGKLNHMADSAPVSSTPGTYPRVILASQSPRRRELLALIGITHEVHPANVDESVHPDEAPVPHCERLARDKAHASANCPWRQR